MHFVDVDADDSHTVAVTPQAGALGSIAAVITTAAEGGTGTVSWIYTADERDFDHLADGETATEVFRVTITDSHGATAFQDVRVTVAGTNDSPVANADIATTSENVAITVSVTVNDTDIDNDTAELTVISAETARANEGVVTFDGGDITFTPGTEFDYLAVGESRIVTVNYTIRDPGGLTASSTLAITVTGTNDVPIVSAPIMVAPVSEDDAAFGIDLLATASDVDISDVLRTESVTVTSSDGRVVSFSIDDAVGKLTLNPAQFGYLDDGEQVTLTVNYVVTDGNGGSVPNTASVVVTGANDAPTISGATKIYAQENFENGAAGWSDPTVSSVPGLTQFLGNFGQGGITEKTFSIPADGTSVIVRFDFHRFDSWDGEDFQVLLNGAVMLQGTFQHGEETVNGGFVPLRDELEDFAFNVWDDSSYRVTLTLTADQIAALPDDGNGGKVFTLGFTSTLNQNADDESWGVDNLLIRAGSGAFRAGDEDSTMAVDGLSVGDIDGDALTVTLDVPAGILMLTDGGGDAVIQNAGSGQVTLSGSAAAINAALKTLLYTPEANANGMFDLTVSAHDGTVSTVRTYDLYVRPVMDATEIVRPAALDFTGTGTNGNDASFSYAIAEGFDSFPTDQGTVEFWVRTTDSSGSLLSYAVPGSANELWLNMASGRLDVWLNNSSLVSVSGTGINDGEWHNVALSFGGGAGQTVLMVDGVAVATLGPTTPLTPGGTIVLGNDQDSVGGSFQVSQALDGQIDGVRIWSSVRDEAQIQATMGQILTPVEHPDLVADYRLDGTLVSAVDGAPAFVLQNADFVNDGSQGGIAGLEQQAISLSDIDILNVDGDLLTVTLTSAQGVVSANGGSGAATVGIVPGGITITGLADDVRAAMDTATFTSNHNFSGTAQIAISVAGGGDGPMATTIPVAITAVNTAPSVSAVQNSTGALLMDGTDSLVTIPHSPVLDFGGTTPMSVEMRVQTSDDVTTLQTLFDKSNLDFVDASAFRFHIAGGRISVWNSSANFDSAPFLQPNTWYDFALSFVGVSLLMYADGVMVFDAPFTMGIANDDPWQIGDDSQGTRDFQGLVDGLRIWNTALTEGEILDHLSNGIADPASEAGLVAAYSFNGADGGVVADLTGNGNSATIQGSGAIAPMLTVTTGTQIESALEVSDADGDVLTYSVQTAASNGMVVVNPDGTFVYTPHADYVGGDIFTLQVSDGQGGVTAQQVVVNVAPALPPVPNAPPSFMGAPDFNAGVFDGTNSHIDVPPETVKGLPAGTIEAWIRLDETGNETIFAQQANGVNSMAIFQVNAGRLFYKSHNASTLTGTAVISAGVWTHVAVTFDGAAATLYVDGVQDVYRPGNFSIPDYNVAQITNTSVGAWRGDGGGQHFDGQMAEFRIWDDVRTQQEINDFRNAALNGTEEGLRTLYQFDEPLAPGQQVADRTGNFNGIAVDVSTVLDETLPIELNVANAFYFNGTTYIEVPDDAALDVRNTFTIEMWINPEAAGTLFSKDGFSDTTGAYNVALTENGDGTMNLQYETNNWGGSVSVGGIVKGEWQHIAVSFDRQGDESHGIVTLFVNGVQVQQGIHGLPADLGTSLMIGRRGVDDDSYTGYMDDIRLWDHARDQGEISSQLSAELSGIEPGLVGYWTFNESGGDTVRDQSGNDNHGTVSGLAIRDTLVDFSVGSNDVYKGLLLGFDADGDNLSYSIADGPSHGTVTLEGNTYVYDHDGTGDSDSFIVAISDGTDTITQQIDVTVV